MADERLLDVQRRVCEMDAVFESIGESVVVYDREGRFTRANHSAREQFGLDPIGAECEDVFARLDVRDMQGRGVPLDGLPSARALRGERVDSVPLTIRRASGDRRAVVVSAAPVIEDGRLAGAVSVWRDETDRVAAEQMLEFDATLLSNVSDAVFAYEFDGPDRGCLLYANEAARSMYGYTEDELMRANARDLIAPEQRGSFGARMAELERKGETRSEGEDVRRDGTRFPVEARLRLIRHQGRRVVLHSSIDVTELVAAERALREKDVAIRNAYTDVIDAVTGGKLVLLTPGELEVSLGEPVIPPIPFPSPAELVSARRTVGEALRSAPFSHGSPDEVLVAVSEALNNALKHAGGGTCTVRRSKRCRQIEVTDHGPGMDFRTLPKATLVPGFSTKQSLGMGFTIMLDAADRVLLATEPGFTAVVLEVDCEGAAFSDAGLGGE